MIRTFVFAGIALFSLCLMTISCTVTGKNSMVDAAPQTEEIRGSASNTTLADALRKNTTLDIMGTHPNVDIIVRGINTIKGDPRPMFIVDGIRMGRNYSQVASTVDVRQIKSIEVIKSLSRLSLYGEDGNSGVIIIKTKKN